MTDALQFEVKKDKWEQLQNGSYKLTVTMNPTDLTDNNDTLLLDFIKSAPGSRFVMAAVRITEDEQPAVQKPKTPFKDLPPSQQAGKMCAIPEFQAWCKEVATTAGYFWEYPERQGEQAAEWVRHKCEVVSRADLNGDPHAEKWHDLHRAFLTDTRLAEQR